MPCPRGLWCGECYANCRGRAAHKGHRHYRASALPKGPMMARFANRRTAQPEESVKFDVSLDTDFFSSFPALGEYLTLTHWEDGTPRQRSTLTIFAEDDCWKCCLNDRDGSRSLFASASTFEGLLRTLERVLESDEVPWRDYAKAKGKGARRS